MIFYNFFFFFPIFGLKQPDFKDLFFLSGQGGFTLTYTLSGLTTEKK